MKKRIFLVFTALCLVAFSVVAFAHSGRTDSNGGHMNHATGEYHYHHGYSAHDHYDIDGNGTIDCPYTYQKSSTSKYSSSSSSGCEGVLAIPEIALIIAPMYFILRKEK